MTGQVGAELEPTPELRFNGKESRRRARKTGALKRALARSISPSLDGAQRGLSATLYLARFASL